MARSWEIDDGLPDNNVTGIAQTRDGYLWISTLGGLARFDGVRFETFPSGRLSGVLGNGVRELLLDRSENLWVGMHRGTLACLRPDAARVFTVKDGLLSAEIVSLAEDAAGAIWIGYASGGFVRIERETIVHFDARRGVPVDGAGLLTTDIEGHLWFAKAGRVGVLEEDMFQTLLALGDGPITMGPARVGGVWICHGDRLLHCDRTGRLTDHGRIVIAGRQVHPTVILEDRRGAIWVGTLASGLIRFADGNFAMVETSHRSIRCLAEDNEGGVWVGTEGGGANRLRLRSVKLWDTDDGLPFEAVQSVCEDAAGVLWAVTANGLITRQSGARWTTLSSNEGWPAGLASCVAADQEGRVWIGTRGEGLHQFFAGETKRWNKENGLASDYVRSLHTTASGNLWIGSPRRLQRFRDGRFETFQVPGSEGVIRALTDDGKGTLWLGTSHGQLWRLRSGGLVDMTPGLDHFWSIRSLHATEDGSLWIGHARSGLERLKDGQFSRVTTDQGLHDSAISQIIADHHGQLWMGADRGIFRVGMEELAAVLEGRRDVVQSIPYGRGEGVPSLQTSFNYVPGAVRCRDGRIVIATRKGVAEIRPEAMRDDVVALPVVVESVFVDGRPMAVYNSRWPLNAPSLKDAPDLREGGVQLHVAPGHRQIEFAYTALSFTVPENVRFRHQLVGFDDDWIEAGAQRVARYRRLPGGRYHFRVMACNHLGVWNEAAATFGFAVVPFFWQTWWFRLSVVAAFTGWIAALVRYVSFRRLRAQMRAVEQQAAVYRERARIAREIHDDLGATLTRIGLTGDLAQRDQVPAKAGRRVAEMSANARRAIKSLDEIVWAVNPRNDTLAHLADYVGQFAVDYLRVAGIRCRLDLPSRVAETELATEVRHNLFLVVKESIHNVVKHSGATEVWLRVNISADTLRIDIEDNGGGFERRVENDQANGLRNMRQRVDEIGGQFSVQSEPGAGTKIAVEFPLPEPERRL